MSERASADEGASRSLRFGGVSLALLAVLVTSGCGSDPPPLALESAHFRVRTWEALPACDGLLPWLEHHRAVLQSTLGVEDESVIEVFVYGTEAEVRDACGTPAAACARGTTIYTTQVFHPHELVHAYVAALGRAPRFFEEGLAEVFGCGAQGSWPVEPDPDIAALFTTSAYEDGREDLPERYALAASFVRFSIERHGLDRFMAFYRAIAREDSRQTIAMRFDEHTGETLDATVSAWATSPAPARDELCIYAAECAAPELDAVPTPLSCGPTPDRLLRPALVRRVTLAEPGAPRFRIDAIAPVQLSLRSCSGAMPGVPRLPARLTGRADVLAEMPPGEYWLDARLSSGNGEASVAVEHAPASARCADVPVRSIEPEVGALVLSGSPALASDDDPINGRGDVAFAFRLVEARTVQTTLHGPVPTGLLWLCELGCPGDADARCMSGSPGELPTSGALLEADVTYYVVSELQTQEGDFSVELRLEPNGS